VPEYRASFDASVTFLNGGGLTAQGFRLDVPGPDVTAADIGPLFVRHLALLMVDRVDVTNLEVFEEPHKGSRGVPVASSERRIVELDHVIYDGMLTYPGLPGPALQPYLTFEQSREQYAPGTEFRIDRIDLVGNTGTYLDSPFHRYSDGDDLAGVPIESVADVPIVVARLTGTAARAVEVAALAALPVEGCAVLLHTGWDTYWGTPAYGEGPAPFLTGAAARWLVDQGAVLVGIDSVNIDEVVPGGERPAHSALLAAGVPVLEHLTGLDQLPATGARLHAAPLRIAGFGTFPVRAYAVVGDH
jgi:kynurenine formamidase